MTLAEQLANAREHAIAAYLLLEAREKASAVPQLTAEQEGLFYEAACAHALVALALWLTGGRR